MHVITHSQSIEKILYSQLHLVYVIFVERIMRAHNIQNVLKQAGPKWKAKAKVSKKNSVYHIGVIDILNAKPWTQLRI